jgi:hypothetical protein
VGAHDLRAPGRARAAAPASDTRVARANRRRPNPGAPGAGRPALADARRPAHADGGRRRNGVRQPRVGRIDRRGVRRPRAGRGRAARPGPHRARARTPPHHSRRPRCGEPERGSGRPWRRPQRALPGPHPATDPRPRLRSPDRRARRVADRSRHLAWSWRQRRLGICGRARPGQCCSPPRYIRTRDKGSTGKRAPITADRARGAAPTATPCLPTRRRRRWE